MEKDLENEYFKVLKKKGENPKQQVKLKSGIVDILSDKRLCEIKNKLIRRAIYQAIGQLVIYGSELGLLEILIHKDKELEIAGTKTEDSEKLKLFTSKNRIYSQIFK